MTKKTEWSAKRHNIIEIENELLTRALEELPEKYGDKLFTALRKGEIYLSDMDSFSKREQSYMEALDKVALIHCHDFDGESITATETRRVDAWGLFHFLEEMHKKEVEFFLREDIITYLEEKGGFVDFFEMFEDFKKKYFLKKTAQEFLELLRSLPYVAEEQEELTTKFRVKTDEEIIAERAGR